MTGKNKSDLAAVYGKDQINTWRRSYYRPSRWGKSSSSKNRVGRIYNEYIKHYVDSGKNILIVAHGNSLRALLVHLGIFSYYDIEQFEINTGVPMKVDTVEHTYEYVNPYKLQAYQIIDSRGYPTVEVKLVDKETKK